MNKLALCRLGFFVSAFSTAFWLLLLATHVDWSDTSLVILTLFLMAGSAVPAGVLLRLGTLLSDDR